MISNATTSRIELILDSNLYNETVIYKCFYWYGRDFSVDIVLSGKEYIVELIPIKKNDSFDVDFWLKKIKQDLIDFKLRDIVFGETRNIRELLTAKAFAYFDIDEVPQTKVSDPVGFNPEFGIDNE